MKKTLILFALTALITSGLFALEVNKNELNSTGDTTIEFINYTGPHKVIDSVVAIKGIGSGLGVQVAKDPSKSILCFKIISFAGTMEGGSYFWKKAGYGKNMRRKPGLQ